MAKRIEYFLGSINECSSSLGDTSLSIKIFFNLRDPSIFEDAADADLVLKIVTPLTKAMQSFAYEAHRSSNHHPAGKLR